MRDSVVHIHGLIKKEVELMGGDSSKVVLAGFSQGCAMTVTSLLLWDGDPLGAAVGMSGFVPLNSQMSELLDENDPDDGSDDGFVFGSPSSGDDDDGRQEDDSPLQKAIDALRDEAELPSSGSPSPLSFLKTPVFLAHGTEDPEIEHQHGRLNAELLQKMGLSVKFNTYQGLAHSYSPEVLGDVAQFLHDVLNLAPV